MARIARALAIAMLGYASPLVALPEPRVTLSSARDFGYVMGDPIEHTLTVAVPLPYRLDASFLPSPGPLNEWLEVRSASWSASREHGETRYQVRVIYQMFRGVRGLEQAKVPELPLRFTGPEALEARSPTWEFTVLPLIPAQLPDEAVTLQAYLPPLTAPVASHRRRLVLFVTGGLLIVGVLAVDRIYRRRRSTPFNRAYRKLKSLLGSEPTADALRSGVRIFHRALDETFGGVLFADDVPRFCAVHAGYAGLSPELTAFFSLSRRLFYAAPEASVPPDYPNQRLIDLSRRCAAVERAIT